MRGIHEGTFYSIKLNLKRMLIIGLVLPFYEAIEVNRCCENV